MKKILFVLGVTFSVYSFLSAEFVVSLNDIELQYAINPFGAKSEDGLYTFMLQPASFMGVSTKDLKIRGIVIGFKDSTNLELASLIFEKKKDVIIFSDRVKRKFNIKNTYDNRYIPEENCPQCFTIEGNAFCIQNRPAINKISVTLFKL